MRLYHATNRDAAENIKVEGKLRPGVKGFAGGAIYFSSSPDAARRKMRQGHASVIITCEVDLGKCEYSARNQMDKGNGFDTVIVPFQAGDVYAVYDPMRIEIIEFMEISTGHVTMFVQPSYSAEPGNVAPTPYLASPASPRLGTLVAQEPAQDNAIAIAPAARWHPKGSKM